MIHTESDIIKMDDGGEVKMWAIEIWKLNHRILFRSYYIQNQQTQCIAAVGTFFFF